MNFLEAVEAMKQGKKVKLKHWDNIDCLYLDKTRNFTKSLILGGGTTRANVSMGEVESTDWEIVEEPKKTLWDKRTRINDGYFELPDVKEALKEFLDYLQDGMDTEDMPRAVWCVELKAKEIFGDELL